jgi:hypothetical protein
MLMEELSLESHSIIPPDQIPRRKRELPTAARPQRQLQLQYATTLVPNLPTRPSHPPRNDNEAPRADSGSFTRHRVRRRWREWELMGVSGQVVKINPP